MKSRLAILATLVLGMLLSTTGAGLAISGMSGSGDAGVAGVTGFAAIPILLGGIALLATGLVMRRRSSEDS